MVDPQAKFEIIAEDRTGSAFKSATSNIDSLAGKFSSFAKNNPALISAVSVAAIFQFSKAVFESADAVGDMAARAGVAASEMSKLKYIAGQSDVEFQSLAIGVKQFQKSLSEGKDVFNEIGISAESLRGLSLTQQFETIADAFKDIKDPADQTRIAMELFGKSGSDLVPLMNQGSEAIRALGLEAEALGVVMSDEAAAKIGEADQAIKRMKASVEGVATSLLAKLSPAIESVADSIRKLTGGETELEKLNYLLNVRDDAIPVLFNFGYDDGLGIVSGPGALDKRIEEIRAKLRGLRDEAAIKSIGQSVNIEAAPIVPTIDIATLEKELDAAAKAHELALRAAWDRQIAELQQTERFKQQVESLVPTTGIDASVVTDERGNPAFDENGQLQIAYSERTQMFDSMLKEQERLLQESTQRQLDIASQGIGADIKSREDAARARQNTEKNVVSSGIAALNAFNAASAKKSKELVAINKAVSIAQAIQNTYVGATKALAQGGIFGFVSAGAIIAFGLAQVAAIARTDYGSGGNPSIAPGTSVNPVFTQNTNGQDDQTQQGASQQKVVNVNIMGHILGASAATQQWLVDTIKEAVDDRDVVLVSPTSRQAQELIPA